MINNRHNAHASAKARIDTLGRVRMVAEDLAVTAADLYVPGCRPGVDEHGRELPAGPKWEAVIDAFVFGYLMRNERQPSLLRGANASVRLAFRDGQRAGRRDRMVWY